MASHLAPINLVLTEDGQKAFTNLQKWLEGPVAFTPDGDFERCTDDDLTRFGNPLIDNIHHQLGDTVSGIRNHTDPES
jgi:hypothetical protein